MEFWIGIAYMIWMVFVIRAIFRLGGSRRARLSTKWIWAIALMVFPVIGLVVWAFMGPNGWLSRK